MLFCAILCRFIVDSGEIMSDEKKELSDSLIYINDISQKNSAYYDTPLDFSEKEKEIPERIRQMQLLSRGESNLYDFSLRKAKVFYVQGKFMENYEDDFPWSGDIRYYYSSYNDLNVKQLRGYFTWRGRIRKGEYERNAEAFAYIYIYELLNGIGVSSPEESIEKLLEFEKKYADEVLHHPVMQKFIKQWIFEFAVVNRMDPETVLRYADPENMKQDRAILILKEPEKYEINEIFEAMCDIAGQNFFSSSVIKKLGTEGKNYFVKAWKFVNNQTLPNNIKFFKRCFGTIKSFTWHPLLFVLYYHENQDKSITYTLNECRSLSYDSNLENWYQTSYSKTASGMEKFYGFMRCTDRLLRIYLKTGRPIQEKREEKWAIPLVTTFIEADKKAREEAKKVNISIDFSNLDLIRKNAVETCDSLLTEEEKAESLQEEISPETQDLPTIRLDETQIEILQALIDGKPAAGIIAAKHEMPELCADAINEAFFDEVGDNVVECDGKDIVLVEDYRDEVAEFLNCKN